MAKDHVYSILRNISSVSLEIVPPHLGLSVKSPGSELFNLDLNTPDDTTNLS